MFSFNNINYFNKFSVKHEYEGQWNEKTRLITCDPHAKRAVTNSESPQEVDDEKEIIFTYDVEFQVCPSTPQQLRNASWLLL